MLTEKEISLGRTILATAIEKGASKVKITLHKNTMDLIATLNGEVDKVSHCLDRAMSISLFVDGRFGTFSTNRFEASAMDAFLDKAVSTVRMLAEDPCRDLPDSERTVKNAAEGRELDIYDGSYKDMDASRRLALALGASIYSSLPHEGKGSVISEEGEYSDNEFDTVIMDSQGLYCRQSETSFDYGTEITVSDGEGGKISDSWWHSSPFLRKLEISGCARTAYERAISHIGAEQCPSRKTNMVVSRDVASKIVTPLLNALNGYSIQQNNSFLVGSLGQKIFPDGLTILDCAHRKGESGSRLFDSEGVATAESAIIEKGVIKEYFLNTFTSRKLGMPPTIEDATRPFVLPWPKEEASLEDIINDCSEGILVTGFNGGNCNSSTGDFSYGIEGFEFRGGKLGAPVHEMVITGNFIDLWGRLKAAGSDIRICMSKLIPTLAFSNVDFSGQNYED